MPTPPSGKHASNARATKSSCDVDALFGVLSDLNESDLRRESVVRFAFWRRFRPLLWQSTSVRRTLGRIVDSGLIIGHDVRRHASIPF